MHLPVMARGDALEKRELIQGGSYARSTQVASLAT